MSSADQSNSLISPRLFVRSVRDLGLDTRDAVNEFVDNSFDANADSIWISIKKNDRGGLTLIVEDNGEGIPPGELVDALKFGGKIERDRETTGKFGFGLPSASFCQGERTEIYTTVEGEPFYFNRLDVDELEAMTDVEIPDTEQKDPPVDQYDLQLGPDTESGTIIIIPHLRNPDRKRVSSLSQYISEELSRVQREIMSDGNSIYVNDEKLPISDPLMCIEESSEVQLLEEESERWGEPFEFEFDGVDYEGESPPVVTVELFILPIDEIIRQDVGDELNIGKDKQGFYIIRENREIGNSLSLNLFTKHDNLNYFRSRIHFTYELDDLFGVQTNKSRFSLDSELREQLEEEIKPQINQIKEEISARRQSAISRYREKDDGMSQAESTANTRSRWQPRSGYDPGESEVEEQEDEAREKLEEVESNNNLSEQQKEKVKEKLNHIIEEDQFIELEVEIPRSGNFYDVKWYGKKLQIQVNPNHEFYEKFYKHLEEDGIGGPNSELDATDVKRYIDLWLVALAKAEDVSLSNETIKKFYERERRDWSSFIADFYEEDGEHIGS